MDQTYLLVPDVQAIEVPLGPNSFSAAYWFVGCTALTRSRPRNHGELSVNGLSRLSGGLPMRSGKTLSFSVMLQNKQCLDVSEAVVR